MSLLQLFPRLLRLKFWFVLALLSLNAQSATLNLPSRHDERFPSNQLMTPEPQEDFLTTRTSEDDKFKSSKLKKRSPDSMSSYFSYNGFDPTRMWMDSYNPGYTRFTSRFGYDPFSIWRKKKLYPRLELRPYMKSYVDDSNPNWALSEQYIPIEEVPQFVNHRLPKRKYYYPLPRETIAYVDEDENENSDEDSYLDNSHFFIRKNKRSYIPYDLLYSYEGKRSPSEMGARGFHEGIFTHGFGDFSPVKRSKRDVVKRRPAMDASGFDGDMLSNEFGNVYTMERHGSPLVDGDDAISDLAIPTQMNKRIPEWDSSGFDGDTFSGGFGDFYTMRKRRPDMDSFGFHGDTFNNGFGDFYTMKRRPEMSASGFHGDTFSRGFGDFYTMKRGDHSSKLNSKITRVKREKSSENVSKRRPETTSSDFNRDMLTGDFRDFYTMKRGQQKRFPEMTSSGFHGDAFSNGFGDFYTMKRDQEKRRPEMTSSGFHGDAFSNGFGDFYTMKRDNLKRRPEMTSSGFYGDTFTNGFGDFYTMKRATSKRRPEMTSSGFNGDTFNNGFGDFYTMKRSNIDEDLQHQRDSDPKKLGTFFDLKPKELEEQQEKSPEFQKDSLRAD